MKTLQSNVLQNNIAWCSATSVKRLC